MPATIRQQIEFYKRQRSIDKQVRRETRGDNNAVVFGSQAVNAQVRPFLRRPTQDWDIFYKKAPRKEARRLEKRLDKTFRGDYFSVEPAQHKGTYKVRNKFTGEVVADYTKPDRRLPPSVGIGGINYANLNWIEKQRRKILKDPEAKFRHQKDRDIIRRIKIQKALARRMGRI